MTTIAALQCVERGLLSLDADISSILTEFKDIQILVSIDVEKGPVLKPATRKITLRNLLTHSSGFAYERTHPKLGAWRKWYNKQSTENKKLSQSTEASIAYICPLLFEPDEGWVYGYGIDWAGIAVSRVSGLSLEAYMKKHIWEPLGMDSTTFSVTATRPDLLSRLANLTERDPKTGKLIWEKKEGEYSTGLRPVKESGGGGAFSTANDYIKLLISLLKNDEKLLRSETVDQMFTPQLSDSTHLMNIHADANPLSPGIAVHIPKETKVDFGLGGLLNLEDLSNTGRSAGGMQWGGIPNLFWWINRKDGICGCYFEQLMPAGDEKSFEMFERYEKAVNESFIKEMRGRL
jgi:CubicO group peptidase (beta-lactamase class C family)